MSVGHNTEKKDQIKNIKKLMKKFLSYNQKKVLSLLSSYFLISTGLFCVCWIIYVRFIRSRTIKDIPLSLSEYGFWFLLYLCILYLLSIILLLRNKPSNETVKILIDIIYKPMIMLDHFIRYNKFTKNHTYNTLENIIKILTVLNMKVLLVISIFFQIIPRIILVTVLFIDIWINHRIEIFYNFILIGLIPFIYRYFKYTLKDLKQQYISTLEEKYDSVWMVEIDTEESIKCDTEMAIKDYIKFKTYQEIYTKSTLISKDYTYHSHKEYEETIMSKEETYAEYHKEMNIPFEIKLTADDHRNLHKLFHDLKPKLILLSVFLEHYSIIENHKIIRWAKIFIFSLYFISWAYVLIISYYANPITFTNTAYKLVQTLLSIEEPFSGIIL